MYHKATCLQTELWTVKASGALFPSFIFLWLLCWTWGRVLYAHFLISMLRSCWLEITWWLVTDNYFSQHRWTWTFSVPRILVCILLSSADQIHYQCNHHPALCAALCPVREKWCPHRLVCLVISYNFLRYSGHKLEIQEEVALPPAIRTPSHTSVSYTLCYHILSYHKRDSDLPTRPLLNTGARQNMQMNWQKGKKAQQRACNDPNREPK